MTSIKKTLLVGHDEYKGDKVMTLVSCNPIEEALYAECTQSIDGKVITDVIELAVSMEEIVNIRNFLNDKIEAFNKLMGENY